MGRGELAAIDRDVRKLLREGEQERLELCRGDLGAEPFERDGEDGGVDLLAVGLDEGVLQLVNEAHGEEGATVDYAFGIGLGSAGAVELVG